MCFCCSHFVFFEGGLFVLNGGVFNIALIAEDTEKIISEKNVYSFQCLKPQ